jgi:hypothetical protein
MSLIVATGIGLCLLAGAALYALSANQLLSRTQPGRRTTLALAVLALGAGICALLVTHSVATALMMTVCGLMTACSLLPLACALLRGESGR